MTYDFHGAFDYTPQGTGRTGFSTNLFMPTNTPGGYNPQFSVNTFVQAALKQGIKSNQIVIGFPAYTTNPSTSTINGQSNLTVYWVT